MINLQIINKENIITNQQIEKILQMLSPHYRPARIIVYEKPTDLLLYFPQCYNFSMEELLGKLEGSYDPASDTVYLCIFAQDHDGDDRHSKQLYSLHALAHELRHRYQMVKDLHQHNEQKSERDADRFATQFVNQNSKKISRIMGWANEWTVID